MTLFALLHGGMHRGSCWDMVCDELHRLGHRTVAPDLPVEVDEVGAGEWAQVAAEAIDRAVGLADRNVIAVGHSISGLILPVVATIRPVRRMVFVAGLLPVPGTAFVDHLADNPEAITFPEPQSRGAGPFGLTWEAVRDGFYHDCPQDIAQRAFDEMRHQSFTILIEPCPVPKWPGTPSTYILPRHDRAVGHSWARLNAVERIGARLIELDGGHSPFFSRPVDLARVLANE